MTPQRSVKTLVGAATLIAVAGAASADVSFRTQLQAEADGTYTMTSGPALEDFRVLLEDILGMYAHTAGNATQTAAHMEGFSPFVINPVPVQNNQGFSNFGSIGTDVRFNPLATGGTHDIATGGDYIEPQLNGQQIQFELAAVDDEKFQHREAYGQVQHQSKQRLSGGGLLTEDFGMTWLGLNGWDPEVFVVDGNGLTQEYDVTISIVPTPGAGLLLGVSVLAGSRRRR